MGFEGYRAHRAITPWFLGAGRRGLGRGRLDGVQVEGARLKGASVTHGLYNN